MSKTIAIDINDTLRDNISQFRRCYQKFIDPSFEIENEDVTNFDFSEIFPFEDKDAFNSFKYIDCPFELFGRAEPMDKMLPYRLGDWLQNTLRDLDEEDIPNVMMVSPFELGLTIQSTLSFLARIGIRCREYYFPIDSSTIWDKCDILITANPYLINSCPEGKTVIKITTPYNKEVETEYTFNSLMNVIQDPEDTIVNMLISEEE